ncbi:glucuronate isomerase [Paenibacillus marinisediminis]
MIISNATDLKRFVFRTVKQTAVTDMHTHLYAPSYNNLLLYGMDEQLTYHYLISEVLRHSSLSYEEYWALSKREQADHIWQTLFLDHSPYSEACRGVLTSLQQLGLDTRTRDLAAYRQWYDHQSTEDVVRFVLEKANVKDVVMTNDPFDDAERELWLADTDSELVKDARFHRALRIDPLLNDWPNSYKKLQAWGYVVKERITADDTDALAEVVRFLTDWARRMDALYMAVSLPSDFAYPVDDTRSLLIDHCIIPACSAVNIPMALMIGVKRNVNPELRLAGDMLGRSDIETVERLCRRFPHNRFLVTMLARENQHELAVLARKFRNLMVFGCWWFLNVPSMIQEMTAMRFELLGTSVIPQHSDCRVLEQLLYKWSHSREIIADVLTSKYEDIMRTGWKLEEHEIERDVQDLLANNFWRFVKK